MLQGEMMLGLGSGPLELTDDFVGSVREMLSLVEHSRIPIKSSKEAILEKLSDQLFSLRIKGFSFHEISTLLKQCFVEVTPDEIKDYYYHEQEKRLMMCEQLLLDYHRSEWNAVVERTAIIERGLSRALKGDGGLILHYQPQVNIHTGEVLGAEALVRWEFNGALVHPAEFIPVAEASGLIVPIGEWVLREACKEAKRWQDLGLGRNGGIKMGVNLSVKQFSDGLPDMVHGILCDTGLPTNLLGLEVTESFLVGNDSLAILHSLRDSGICLSIDDFGTGFSCLAKLKDLPLDTIKIDRAFVQDLGREENSVAVVESIVNLAKKLNMKTLAEGVENEVQAEVLKDLGCSVCQGYLYSKPLPGAEFVQYARNRAVA